MVHLDIHTRPSLSICRPASHAHPRQQQRQISPLVWASLPQLAQRHLLIVVLVQNLGRSQLEVLLRNMDSPLPQGIHARLCAHALQFCAGAAIHLFSNLGQVDTSGKIHLAAVNAQNIRSGLDARRREFDFTIDAAWSEERGVQNVQTVRGHDDFDVLGGLETVQLVEELQHGALDLRVASRGAFDSRRTNAVDFVHEDDGRRMLTCHDEELAHHAGSFANVLLDEFRAGHSDEFTGSVVCDGSGEEGFACTGRAVEEHALGLGDSQGLEELGVLEAQLDDFFDFLDLLVETTNHVVGAVGHFLDHHERYKGVDGRGEEFLELVAVGEEGDALSWGELGYVDIVGNVDDYI